MVLSILYCIIPGGTKKNMKTIIVDDEPYMLKSFLRLSEGVDGIEVTGKFEYPEDALEFAEKQKVDLAMLDIATGFVKAESEKKVINNNLPVYNDKPWRKEQCVETSKKITDKKTAFKISFLFFIQVELQQKHSCYRK